jgi:four helix bundle protein
MQRIEEIHAWQKARELVQEIYKTCADGSLARDFGLGDQLRRAAVSSMSNIAEGFGRKSDREFTRFLDIDRGSVVEVQSLLYVALDVYYIDRREFERLNRIADDTASLIGGLTTYLRNYLVKTSRNHETVARGPSRLRVGNRSSFNDAGLRTQDSGH